MGTFPVTMDPNFFDPPKKDPAFFFNGVPQFQELFVFHPPPTDISGKTP
jgi:hypothetical protein